MYMWLCVYVSLHLTSYLVIMNSLPLIKYLIACQTVCVTPYSCSSQQQAADAFVAYLAPDFTMTLRASGDVAGDLRSSTRWIYAAQKVTKVFYVLDFNSEGKQTYLFHLISILQVEEKVKQGKEINKCALA